MKIVYIANAAIPSCNANSVHVMKMCQALKKKGNEVTLVVPDHRENDGLEASNIFEFYGVHFPFDIIKMPEKTMARQIRFTHSAVRYAKKIGADLVYSRIFKAAFWANRYKIPVIIELHQPFKSFVDMLLLRGVNRWKYLEKIAVITRPLQEWCRNNGIEKSKITILADAVDIERFPQPSFYQKKNLHEVTIGYVGNLYRGRGIDLILSLAERIRYAKFSIIGGKHHDVQYWSNLAQKRGLGNVHFFGFIPNSRLPQEMNNIDIFLMPHQKRVALSKDAGDIAQFTSPMKMFEYMACGKPIIVSDLPVLQEVLQNKINCTIVAGGNVADWQSAIEHLIGNPQYAKDIGEQARREVEQKYTWDIRVDKILRTSQN